MNRWELTEERERQYKPIVEAFIKKAERGEIDEVNLSDTHLNAYTLWKLLENLGYQDEDGVDRNGWDLGYCIRLNKENCRTLLVRGTGLIFELILSTED